MPLRCPVGGCGNRGQSTESHALWRKLKRYDAAWSEQAVAVATSWARSRVRVGSACRYDRRQGAGVTGVSRRRDTHCGRSSGGQTPLGANRQWRWLRHGHAAALGPGAVGLRCGRQWQDAGAGDQLAKSRVLWR